MKRSTSIVLGATGVVLAASAFSLMGGEGEKLVYDDPAACRSDGKFSGEVCDARFREARERHARDARRFSSQRDCEGEYGSGRCETFSGNGASVWVPALAGIMLARGGGLMQPLMPPTRAMCPPGSAVPECQPGRPAGSGGSGGSGGGRWYSTHSGGSVSTGRRSGSGTTSTGVTSRGGFGSTGRGISSGS